MQTQLIANYVNTADAANSQGDYNTALKWSMQALQLAPLLPEAWYNLGIACAGLGRRAEAMDAFEKTRIYTSNSVDAQNSIGLQLIELGAYPEAELCLKRALALAPDYAFAHSNLGKLREKQRRFRDAEASFRKAMQLQPELVAAHANLGGVLNAQQKHEAAQAACRTAIELDPKSPEAWSNLGSALHGLGRFEAAESACRKAVELDPKSPGAWINLGNALHGLKRFEAAESACREAISLDPDSPQAWSNLGSALLKLRRLEDAEQCLERSLKLDPDAEFLFGTLIYTRMKLCDWRSLENDLPELLGKIDQGIKAADPFVVLGLTDDPAMQRKAAEIWVGDRCPEQPELGPLQKRNAHDKIRIGYYSADYHNHATMYLMAELFERHDKEKFELVGFSFGIDRNDDMRKRVVAAFDQFIDVRGQSDKEVAQLSRQLEIDIAVDLKGHTENCRSGIFSYRAAPIQVSYLGYPGSMGATYIDYVLADQIVIPAKSQQRYTEKVVHLPNSYQVNDAKRSIADRIFKREELGLPTDAFVLCCFNNSYKITPSTFDCWMRILKQVENSVLWLFEENPTAANNLRREAESRGVDAARLVFAKPMPLGEHLARHRAADLFVDTLPYNAHTTASDALWVGLPVLTCTGEAFASRVAASLLVAISLPELVASNRGEYEALAVDLASHPEKLADIKRRLEQNRLTTPLFDTPLFTKNIETAYAAMVARSIAGKPAACMYISQ